MNKRFLTHILFALFFISLSFGQLEKIQLYLSISVHIHELLMGVWILYIASQNPISLSKGIAFLKKTSWAVKAFSIWILAGWLIALFSHANLLNPVLFTARILFYGVFFYSVTYSIKKKLISLTFLKTGLFMAGCYLLYFGLLQYVVLPDTRFLLFLGWDDHYYRLISTILDPGFTGILFLLNIFLLFQIWQEKLSYSVKISADFAKSLFGLLLGTFTLGISLTYSRATYLAYAVSAIVTAAYFGYKKRTRIVGLLILGSLLLLAISIPFLPRPDGEGVKLERTSTISARSTTAQSALTELKPWQWVTGQGMFVTDHNQLNSSEISHNRVPDNWLIMFLSGTGIVGTILFITILLQLLKRTFFDNVWLWFGVLAVLVHGLFNASLIYPFVVVWLGILGLQKNQDHGAK